MASKQQDVAKLNISPVLFMAVDGEPMSFFLRPGPVKRKLQPLIKAGGGMLCNIQQPGAILLIDPEERGSLAENAAHRYVSIQYIHDCIEKDEQLNLEDYRLNPEVVPRHSARLNNNKESCPGGRVAYTTEDDAAILSYVSEHKAETGGNRLWQEMEKQRVTSHSWQSMKYRYRVRLAKKQSEAVEVPTTEGETKVEGNEGTDAEKPSSSEDAASPQTHPTESDLTQIDQPIPAEHTQPEIVEAQTSICPQGEEQHVSPQTSKQPADGAQVETVEADTSDSPQPEGACSDPPTDAHPIPAESTEPETDAPQTIISPQKESLPEDSPPAPPNSLPDSSSQKKPKEKQKSSPRLEQPQRRSTRRQLQLEDSASPEPYGKKLRSSLSSAEQPSTSPQPLKKTKSAHISALQKDTTDDEEPSKRAEGKSAAESKQETSGQDAVSETTRAESNPMPQKGEKKKEKRKLGILELATKEFEDESESGEDEASDLQNPTETATAQPTSTEPRLQTPDTAASAQAGPERGPGLQEKVPEAQASSSNRPPPTGCPEPAATEPAAVSAASKAHLFIFDSESQEEGSQSMFGDSTAAPANLQPTVNKDAAFSLTQVQLEEDKQRITELMRETKQDLVSVTKALLKTSGDFSAALDLLLNPFAVSGPFWKRSDDGLLLSGDPVVRQQLQERYGEEKVAKRVMFLELEG
ncbi:telomeric repeat-binding factor 2-interacting protein 1 isoform X2 [Chaetodon auriga]|uniref:telomeric repeat-binding factor 2-interacting protein 1 isoform X2 n=1 Tax=Chaetodon auriga TaxID=39042 RepID=UPI0040331247